MGKEIKNLPDDVEYIIIQNEETEEIIAEITQDNADVIKPFVIRTKYNNSKIKMYEKSGNMCSAEHNKNLKEIIKRLQELDKTEQIKSIEVEY